MSVNATQDGESCTYCGDTFDWGHKPGYCSPECWWQSKGENIVKQIQNDHRFCTSCFRCRKEIEKPPEWFLKDRPLTIRDSIVGFEYYTEHIHKAHGLTYCECGNVEHYGESETLRDLDTTQAVKNLTRLLIQYEREGQLHTKPDVRTLAKTINETNDYLLAIGKSLYER